MHRYPPGTAPAPLQPRWLHRGVALRPWARRVPSRLSGARDLAAGHSVVVLTPISPSDRASASLTLSYLAARRSRLACCQVRPPSEVTYLTCTGPRGSASSLSCRWRDRSDNQDQHSARLMGRVDEDASIVATTTVRASGPDLARRSVRPPRSGSGSPEPDSTKDRRAVRTVRRSAL